MQDNTLYIQWHITAECNFNCRHCYQDDRQERNSQSWHTLKNTADNIIGSLRRMRKKAVINVTGGEPLLHKGFFALLRYLDSFDEIEELAVITNGFLLSDENIERLSRVNKLSAVKVSLEGADELSNSMVRPAGTFNTVVENIRRVVSSKRFKTLLMFTLTNDNIAQIARMFDLCVAEDLDGFIVERFIPLGKGRLMSDSIISAHGWEKAVRMLLARCSIDIPTDGVLAYKGFFAENTHSCGIFDLKGAECAIGKGGLAVMENGDVYPCRRLPVEIGNLLKQPLDNVLNSPFLRDLGNRRKIKGRCGDCDMADCLGCRALAYAVSGDAFAEEKACWYKSKCAERLRQEFSNI